MSTEVQEEHEPTSSSSSSSDENSDDDPEFKISENLEIDEIEEGNKGKTKNKYRCHICGKSFPFPNKVKEHMAVHETGRYSCPKCPDLHFDTHVQLRSHNGKFHSTASHTCPLCPFNSNRRFFVAQHFEKNHVEGIPCTIAGCSLKFAKNRLKIHIREAHGGKKVRSAPKRAELEYEKCPICDFVPENGRKEHKMDEILEHMKSAHDSSTSSSKIACTLNCGAEILLKDLMEHLNSTCPNFKTIEAPPTFQEEPPTTISDEEMDRGDLDVDEEEDHHKEPSAKRFRTEGEFQCEICGKQCRKMEALRKHVKLNHSAKPATQKATKPRIQKQFNCDRIIRESEVCGKKFRTEQALQDHFNVHDDIKPYQCVSCDQRFHARDRFAVHLQKYHRTSIKDLNDNWKMMGIRMGSSGTLRDTEDGDGDDPSLSEELHKEAPIALRNDFDALEPLEEHSGTPTSFGIDSKCRGSFDGPAPALSGNGDYPSFTGPDLEAPEEHYEAPIAVRNDSDALASSEPSEKHYETLTSFGIDSTIHGSFEASAPALSGNDSEAPEEHSGTPISFGIDSKLYGSFKASAPTSSLSGKDSEAPISLGNNSDDLSPCHQSSSGNQDSDHYSYSEALPLL